MTPRHESGIKVISKRSKGLQKMCTKAEMTKIARDTAELGVADLIEVEDDAAYGEILEIAIDYAVEEFDAEQESDGSWNDCTNYQACAERATEHWMDDQAAMYEAMQDDRAHAMADLAAGL